MKLAAIDTGTGPAVVLLHGQPGNGGDWAAVTSRLRERHRVLVPDRLGYGRTGGRAAGFADNAAAVIDLLDRLGVGSAVLAGHSWATGVVLAAASRFPARVRALILAAPVAPGIPPAPIDRLLASPLIGPGALRVGFRVAGIGLAVSPIRRLAHSTVPALPPEQVALTAAQWRGDRVWKSFYIEQRALVEELPSLAPRLGSIHQPATILHGRRDWISTPAHGRRLARDLPRAELIAVERAGHMLPQQRPGVVADAIARLAVAA